VAVLLSPRDPPKSSLTNNERSLLNQNIFSRFIFSKRCDAASGKGIRISEDYPTPVSSSAREIPSGQAIFCRVDNDTSDFPRSTSLI
jgi:hypothetical protein